MAGSTVLLLKLLALAVSFGSSSAGECGIVSVSNFTEEPRDTTCVLEQVFPIRCSPPGYAATVRWLLGGEGLYITHPPPGIVPTSRRNLFQLDITCTPERHYLTVQCIAVIEIGVREEESPPALIRVQGFPDRVDGIRTLSNCSSIRVVWDSPLGPSLTYCVAVYNSTDGASTDAGTCMLSAPSFVLEDTEATSYEFIITAVSELGPGPPSMVVMANTTTCEQTESVVSTGFTEEPHVQGFPDRVDGIRTLSNCSSIQVVWDSPLGPHLTYCVAVYNTADGASTDAGTCMLSAPSFVLEDIEATSYEFIITAVSELGPGPPSMAVMANTTTCEQTESVVSTGYNSSVPITLIIAIGVIFFVLTAVSVAFCVGLLIWKKNKQGLGTSRITMITCDAYENPKDIKKEQMELPTYETIREPDQHVYEDHVYEHIKL